MQPCAGATVRLLLPLRSFKSVICKNWPAVEVILINVSANCSLRQLVSSVMCLVF